MKRNNEMIQVSDNDDGDEKEKEEEENEKEEEEENYNGYKRIHKKNQTVTSIEAFVGLFGNYF